MGWKVFLPENYIDRVESKVRELAHSIAEVHVDGEGLMGGAAGQACFYAYYSDWTGDTHFEKLALDSLEQAINPAGGHFPGYKFCDGLAGIGWTIDHLINVGMLTYETTGIFDHLDPHLYDAMMQEIKTGHFDYLHGAMGIALYFLRKPEEEKYRSHLSELVNELHKHAVIELDGSVKWLSLLDGERNIEGYNLSLSHGMASIIIMLSRIMEAGIEVKLCSKLIRGSIKYLEKQRLDPDNYISTFPSWARESMEEIRHSRLAWCYGDLGIGMAYLSAGIQLPEEKYGMEGIDILLKTCKRKDPDENNVHDAGICHGAAGIALIYNVLYQKLGNKTFMEAALYWLDVCLNMASHDDGLAGYKAWYHEKYGGWKATPGLLEGASGIGLVLMSFVSGREASWSQSLLLIDNMLKHK